MKRLSLILLLFFAVNQICSSQTKKQYNIYLVFNSDNQEMNVADKTVNDSVKIKTFSFSKDLATEEFKYALSIGDNGKLNKDSSQTPESKELKVRLYHYSYMHDEEAIADLSQANVIDYEDFMNAEFKSFNTILNRASKIFIVDVKEKDKSIYKAYQVKL